MSPLEFSVMFALGLVSSLHCIQMCGPIVLSYSVSLESLTAERKQNTAFTLLLNHLAYNAGRILTYSALGAIAGFVGHSMGLLGRLAGFGHALAIVSGVLMIVVGISLFGVVPTGLVGNRLFRVPSSLLRRAGRLLSSAGTQNRFFLGLALGFLPCGLIYAAILKAMATASVFEGMLAMLGFGLGTAGSLLAVGIFSSALRMRLNRWGSQVAAAGVMVMGLWLIWRGTMPGMMVEGHMHAHH